MIINKDFRRRVDFVVRQTWKNIEKTHVSEAGILGDLNFAIVAYLFYRNTEKLGF